MLKYISSFGLILVVLFSCNSNQDATTTETTTTSEIPSEEKVDNIMFESLLEVETLINKKLEDGSISQYIVRDGDNFIAESTTYYHDEEKVQPVMTKIIYITGNFMNIYWLENDIILARQDDYHHVFDRGELVASFLDSEPTELSAVEREEILQIPTVATKIINTPSANQPE